MNINVLNDTQSLAYYNIKPAKLIPNALKTAKKCELVNFKLEIVSTKIPKAQLQLQTIQYNTHTYINYPCHAKIFPAMLSFAAKCRYYNSKWRV